MESGIPWKKLLERYPKSTVYDSVKSFFDLTEPKYSETLRKNRELFHRIQNQKAIIEESDDSIQSLRLKESELEEKISQLVERETDLSNQVATLESSLEDLKSSIGELEGRGINIEVLEGVLNTDIESSQDLTRRVQTRQEYEALIVNIQNESDTFEQLRSDVVDESASLGSLRVESKSEMNRIAQLREKYAHLSDAIDVVMDALVRYPIDLIKGLFESLRSYEIEGAPAESMRRLLDKLSLAKEDLELQRSISSRSKVLEAISQELDNTRGILRALKKDSLKPIRDTQNNASRAIEQASAECVNAVREAQRDTLEILVETRDASTRAIGNMDKSGKASLIDLRKEIFRILNESSLGLQARLDNYERQIQRWGESKQEAGRYETIINQGILLFGILEDSRAILNLDLRIASTVSERLHLYVSMKHSHVRMRAPADVAKEWAISDVYDVELTSVTKWLCEAMKELLREAYS
jgi:chromosome segregation ATPase